MSTRALIMAAIALMATGCGKPVLDVAPEFQPYVATFERASEASGHAVKVVDLRVAFGDTSVCSSASVTAVGCCLKDQSPPTILVSRTWWNAIYSTMREELVLHEMGHCVLGRGHRNDDLPDGRRASIMNLNEGPLPVDYEAHRDEYLGELFAD